MLLQRPRFARDWTKVRLRCRAGCADTCRVGATTTAYRGPATATATVRRAQRRLAVVCAVGAAALALIVSAAEFKTAGIPQDEGLLLVYPELILHGQTPFGAFQSSYGPGAYMPLSVVYTVTGPGVTAERAVGTAYKLAIVGAVAWVAWPLGELAALAGAALVFLGIFFDGPPTAWGWFFALACLFASVGTARSALRSDRRGRWLLAGAFAGLAVSARFDLALALAGGMVIMLWPARWRARVLFLAGGFLGLAPLVWNLLAAGLSSFWTYAVQARLHQLPASGYPLPTGLDLLAIIVAMTAVVLLAAAWVFRRDGLTPVTGTWLALAVIAVLLVPQMLQRPDPGHFVYVAPAAAALIPLVLAEIRWPLMRGVVFGLAAVGIVYGSGFVVREPTLNVRNDGRSFPYSSFYDPYDVQSMVTWASEHVRPGTRLLVGPRDFRSRP